MNGQNSNISYGFYGRLSNDFPSQIIVDVTEKCNYNCLHCPHGEYETSEIYDGSNLDVKLNKKMIKEVKRFGDDITHQIRYTANGEPLLHPQISNMINYASKNTGAIISLTTNGSLLNSNKIDLLLGSGIDLIDVSIDAYSEATYSKIRQKGKFEIVKSNVLKLLKKVKKTDRKIKVVVSFVEQALNQQESNQFKKFWENHGVDEVIIRRLHSAGGALNDKDKVKVDERKPCVYPWERITLNSKGELDFCPNSWQGLSTIINYKETTIKKLWNSKFYQKLREAHLNNNLNDFEACKQCPDWQNICWPHEGRGYGDMIKEFIEEN